MPRAPLLSVVMVAWNNKAHIAPCLSMLSKQSLPDFEVILVDNGSTDNAADGLETRWTGLHLTVQRLPSNLGFAAANNIGARLAHGNHVVI